MRRYSPQTTTNEFSCYQDRARTFSIPDVPTNVIVESDNTVTLTRAGNNITVTMSEVDDQHFLIARLGTNNPILAFARLDGFWVRATTLGRFKIVQINEDGSQVWENTLEDFRGRISTLHKRLDTEGRGV